MITEFGQGKYYLYRHIRLDKKEVFYIGIGTKLSIYKDIKSEYKRAFDKSNRNKFWKNITSKTDYDVEIILESNDYEWLNRKEIEFIALYGHKILKQGTLCNLTRGGEQESYVVPKKIYVYNLKGKYLFKCSSLKECSEKTQVCTSHIREICKENSNRQKAKGFLFKYYYKPYVKTPVRKTKNVTKCIGKYDSDNNLLEVFRTSTDVCNKCNISRGNLHSCLTLKQKTAGGFKWRYIDGSVPEKKFLHKVEVKNIISEKATGNKSKSKLLIDKSTSIVYASIKEAAIANNINYYTLCRKLNKDSKNNTNFTYC